MPNKVPNIYVCIQMRVLFILLYRSRKKKFMSNPPYYVIAGEHATLGNKLLCEKGHYSCQNTTGEVENRISTLVFLIL